MHTQTLWPRGKGEDGADGIGRNVLLSAQQGLVSKTVSLETPVAAPQEPPALKITGFPSSHKPKKAMSSFWSVSTGLFSSSTWVNPQGMAEVALDLQVKIMILPSSYSWRSLEIQSFFENLPFFHKEPWTKTKRGQSIRICLTMLRHISNFKWYKLPLCDVNCSFQESTPVPNWKSESCTNYLYCLGLLLYFAYYHIKWCFCKNVRLLSTRIVHVIIPE